MNDKIAETATGQVTNSVVFESEIVPASEAGIEVTDEMRTRIEARVHEANHDIKTIAPEELVAFRLRNAPEQRRRRGGPAS